MKWQYRDNNVTQLVDELGGTVRAEVKKLSELEWSWEYFDQPNGYGRESSKGRACEALNTFVVEFEEKKALRDIAVELHTKVLEYKHLEMLYSSDMSKMLLSYIEQAYRLGRI